MRLRRNEYCPIHEYIELLWARTHAQSQADQAGDAADRRSAPPERVSRTPFTGRNPEVAQPKNYLAGQEMRDLPPGVYRL
jgi:hypothetical protein